MDEPKDLGIKIGTRDEAFWTSVKEKAERDILAANRENEINEVLIKYAKERIAQEVLSKA